MAKSKKKRVIIFLVVLVLVIVIVMANIMKKKEKTKVQTDKVTRGKITETVSGSAKIQPEIQVKISANVSGQIMDLGVKEGDIVTRGQFLVQLDPDYYRAVVEQAESSLKSATAGYEKATSEYKRLKQLFDGNLASESDLEMAKASYEQAESNVEQSNASLKQAKDNLAKTTIYSPMNGIVSQLNKKIGEMAMGSQFTLDVIMVVADLDRMLAETEIDENDVVSVSISDTAKITVDAFPDTTFIGLVTEIANTGTVSGLGSQEEVTNFLVKVLMLEKPERLRPSMSATVDIITESKEDVLKVPIQCVTVRKPLPPKDLAEGEDTEKSTGEKDTAKVETPKSKEDEKPIKVVFVVKENIVSQIPVTTGISSDTEWEIKSGVEENDEVVSGSYRILSKQLKDGDEVKVDNSMKKELREEE